MARIASQRFFSRKSSFLPFFVPYNDFSTLFRIEILRKSVKFSARELRSETISCIFGWCLYQNNLGLFGSLCTFAYNHINFITFPLTFYVQYPVYVSVRWTACLTKFGRFYIQQHINIYIYIYIYIIYLDLINLISLIIYN